jgi:hypothetical protein
MPEYGFGRCDGHHEMVDLQKKRNASDCYYISKIRQSLMTETACFAILLA